MDKRHSQVKLISHTKTTTRVFHAWAMGCHLIDESETKFNDDFLAKDVALFKDILKGNASNSEGLAKVINRLFFNK